MRRAVDEPPDGGRRGVADIEHLARRRPETSVRNRPKTCLEACCGCHTLPCSSLGLDAGARGAETRPERRERLRWRLRKARLGSAGVGHAC